MNIYMYLLTESFPADVALVIPLFAVNHADMTLKTGLRIQNINYLIFDFLNVIKKYNQLKRFI